MGRSRRAAVPGAQECKSKQSNELVGLYSFFFFLSVLEYAGGNAKEPKVDIKVENCYYCRQADRQKLMSPMHWVIFEKKKLLHLTYMLYVSTVFPPKFTTFRLWSLHAWLFGMICPYFTFGFWWMTLGGLQSCAYGAALVGGWVIKPKTLLFLGPVCTKYYFCLEIPKLPLCCLNLKPFTTYPMLNFSFISILKSP